MHDIQTAKQAHEFGLNTECIIGPMKKNFLLGDDIGDGLKNEKCVEPTEPTRKRSVKPSADKKKFKQELFDVAWKGERETFNKRVTQLEADKGEARALIHGQCSDRLIAHLKTRSDHKAMSKDPIKLLEAMKEQTHQFHEDECNAITLLDAQSSLFNIKQGKEEDSLSHHERFKSVKDDFEKLCKGKLIHLSLAKTDGFSETHNLNCTGNETAQEKLFEQAMALHFMRQADRARHGSLIVELAEDKALGNERHPKMLEMAKAVLHKHKCNQACHDRKAKKNKAAAEAKKDKTNDQSSPASTSDDATAATELTEFSFANLEGKCWCCGKAGHKSNECRKRETIPQHDWAINKASHNEQMHVVQMPTTASSSDLPSQPVTTNDAASVSNSTLTSWQFLQVCQFIQPMQH